MLRTIGTCSLLWVASLECTIESFHFYHNDVYLAYSTSFCLICTSQVLKQEINKAFYIFYKLKVLLHLDDTSPTCTYLAKYTA